MSDAPVPPLWTLTDGAAGNRRQAEALAAALALPQRPVVLACRAPWRWAAPRILPGADRALGASFRRALEAPPALAIGCGRVAALGTRLLRARGARAVQILDPRLPPALWDAVVAPRHDRLRGENVIQVCGSLHPVDDAWLAAARACWTRLEALPAPRIGLLLGGPVRGVPWTPADLDLLLRQLHERARAEGGSILATTSRRTPAWAREALRLRLDGLPGLRWQDERDGPNPYAGILACSQFLAASADSVNLLSEAAATRVPLQAVLAARARGRHAAFLDELRARGRLHPAGAGAGDATVEPVRELPGVAAWLHARLGLGRPRS